MSKTIGKSACDVHVTTYMWYRSECAVTPLNRASTAFPHECTATVVMGKLEECTLSRFKHTQTLLEMRH